MSPCISRSVSVRGFKSLLTRAAILGALLLAPVASSQGQAPSPRPGPNTVEVRWRKYVNSEFGFSIWYPDMYKPSDFEGSCTGNSYREYLLCLQRPDDPDSSIIVSIIVDGPFFVKSNPADDPYSRQRTGRHDFYCGWTGSMGVGFIDECDFNLRGKVLEFGFSPAETINSGKKMNPLASKVLQHFACSSFSSGPAPGKSTC